MVAFALVVYGRSYPTQVYDNTSYQKDGCLALQQISSKISRDQEIFQIKVITVCTDSGSDQVRYKLIIKLLYLLTNIAICAQTSSI